MKFKSTVLLSLSVLAMNTYGESSRGVIHHPVDAAAPVVETYTDLLRNYKMQLDSLQKANTSLSSLLNDKNGKYSRLFLPMTFYHNISHNQFRLFEDLVTNSMFDKTSERALLCVYLKRFDLVQSMQTRPDAQGLVSTSQDAAIKMKTAIVEKVAPTPTEVSLVLVDVVIKKSNFWKLSGDGYPQFLQNCVLGNRYKVDESNYSMLGIVTLNANHDDKRKVKWDNKLEMKLGFQTSKSDTLHTLKTHIDDIRYASSFGLQAFKRWYYSLQLITNVQFMRGYHDNDERVYSDFLSPLNVELFLGTRYNVGWFKGKLKGDVNIAPFAYHYRYVGRGDLVTRFGIGEDKHYVGNYGSGLDTDLTWKFSDMVRWKTRLYGYTSYKRTEMEWGDTLTVQLTKYLSTNLYVYPRFSDSREYGDYHGYFMHKEYLSVGSSYSF